MRRSTTLTIADVLRSAQGRLEVTEATLALAKEAVGRLWQERSAEHGQPFTGDRSGSCKFAALLARELFGGRLAGNLDHVFVMRPDGQLLDINADQADVQALGRRAHRLDCGVLKHVEYREALGSCMPRVRNWVEWVEQVMVSHADAGWLPECEGNTQPVYER